MERWIYHDHHDNFYQHSWVMSHHCQYGNVLLYCRITCVFCMYDAYLMYMLVLMYIIWNRGKPTTTTQLSSACPCWLHIPPTNSVHLVSQRNRYTMIKRVWRKGWSCLHSTTVYLITDIYIQYIYSSTTTFPSSSTPKQHLCISWKLFLYPNNFTKFKSCQINTVHILIYNYIYIYI